MLVDLGILAHLSCATIAFTWIAQMVFPKRDSPSCHAGLIKLFCGAFNSFFDLDKRDMHGTLLEPQATDVEKQTNRCPSQEPSTTAEGCDTAPPLCPFVANQMELDMLRAQAMQLQFTIARRNRIEAASCTDDNVSDIVKHYQSVLDGLQSRIVELAALSCSHTAATAA